MTRNPRRSMLSPTRAGLGVASLALAGLLLLGFKAPDSSVAGSASPRGSAGSSGGTTGASGTTGSSGTSGASGSTSGSTGRAAKSSGTKTVDGAVVDTMYGPVEVEITVSNGKITAVTAIELPSGGRSSAISSYAAPLLSSEALSAQSATIDVVSGATYTSEGYAQSLQSALDKAGI